MAGGAAGGVGGAAKAVVTWMTLYVVVFVVVQVAICVQLYRTTQAAMRVHGRVWYHFAVLALLAVAEGVTLLGMHRLTR